MSVRVVVKTSDVPEFHRDEDQVTYTPFRAPGTPRVSNTSVAQLRNKTRSSRRKEVHRQYHVHQLNTTFNSSVPHSAAHVLETADSAASVLLIPMLQESKNTLQNTEGL